MKRWFVPLDHRISGKQDILAADFGDLQAPPMGLSIECRLGRPALNAGHASFHRPAVIVGLRFEDLTDELARLGLK